MRAKHSTNRRPRRCCIEPLERRVMLDGTWTQHLAGFPLDAGVDTLSNGILLSDGSVMLQGGGPDPVVNTPASAEWFKLTPDASGGYSNTALTSLATMSDGREFFASDVLPDGRVFVAGAEDAASTGQPSATGEIYDPLQNTWPPTADFTNPVGDSLPGGVSAALGDASSMVLGDGTVLVGDPYGPEAQIFTPGATDQDPGSWSPGPSLPTLPGGGADDFAESTWVKLPDGSVLMYDVNASNVTGTPTAYRFTPGDDTWLAVASPPEALQTPVGHAEMGPAFLLQDGRALFIGATGETALYTPLDGSYANGYWSMGPEIRDSDGNLHGVLDAPGAEMDNGKILFVAGDTTDYAAAQLFFEFDPSSGDTDPVSGLHLGTITEVMAPGGPFQDVPPFYDRMLALPNGQILVTDNFPYYWLYTPELTGASVGRPAISAITNDGVVNGVLTFTLTGTQLNGFSEGAAYGDDAQMATNYPIVELLDTTGNVNFARTYDWDSTGVQTDSQVVQTKFTDSVAPGAYLLSVSASGISSQDVLFVQMGTGADNLTLRLDPNDITQIQILQAGNPTPLAEYRYFFNQILIVGGAENGAVTLDESNGPILAQGDTLNYDGGGGTNALKVIGAGTVNNQAILTASVFTLNSNTFSYQHVQSVEFDGGAGNDTLTIAAALAFSPVFNGGGGNDTLNVNAGTFAPTGDAGSGAGNPLLTINDNAAIIFGASQNLAVLNIAAGASATLAATATPDTESLDVGTLTIAPAGGPPTGWLDVGDNMMRVTYGASDPVAAIRAYLVSGYDAAGALWTGDGIRSSSAAANPSAYAVGYADSADGIVTGLPANTILVMYTRNGDATLDGMVNFSDLTDLSQHYNDTGASWDEGDFNYDGTVNFPDLVALAQNYGQGV